MEARMTRLAAAYAATLITYAALDILWIGSMGNVIYRPVLRDILLTDFKLAPAIIFYLLLAAGIVIFAVSPAIRSGNGMDALLYGALFGFFAYATYDLTNQATLRNWTTTITLIDIAWGTFAVGVERLLR